MKEKIREITQINKARDESLRINLRLEKENQKISDHLLKNSKQLEK